MQFSVTVSPAPGDPSPTTPTVSLFISNLPAGAQITGATLNPNTGRYIATKDDLDSGAVRIIPPPNYSGTMPITVEAVAMNTQLNTATTGPQTVNVTVTPVADGPSITASPQAGVEDTATLLNISVGFPDNVDRTPGVPGDDTPEALSGFVRVTVSNGATLNQGTLVSPGVYDLTLGQLAGLRVTPAPNWHGAITVGVQATGIEPDNGATRTTSASFTVNVAGRRPAQRHGRQCRRRGGRRHRAHRPVGRPRRHGRLRGALGEDHRHPDRLDPVRRLQQRRRQLDHSGRVAGGPHPAPAQELQRRHEPRPRGLRARRQRNDRTRTVPFTVTVTPVADGASINPQNVTAQENAPRTLNLGVLMADANGASPGENAPELVEITLTNLMAGSGLTATGGTLVQLNATDWRFTGTKAQADTLAYLAGNNSGVDTVNISVVTIDGASRSAASAGQFDVTITPRPTRPRSSPPMSRDRAPR